MYIKPLVISLVAIMAFWTVTILLINHFSNEPKHVCVDKTHQTCDGSCECDGMECEGF